MLADLLGQRRFSHNSWVVIVVAYALAFAVALSIGLATAVVVLFAITGRATCVVSAAGDSNGCVFEVLENVDMIGVG